MSWVKLDDQFFSNPKVLLAGRDARDLYLAGLAFCAAQLTDGFIPDNALRMLAAQADVDEPAALAVRLVAVDLWERLDDGYQIHDWLKYNPPASEQKRKRDLNAERQARFREAHAEELKQKNNARRNALRNAGSNGGVTRAPSPSPYPIDSNEIERESSDGDGANASACAADLHLCSQITKAAGLTASVDSLQRLINRHKKLTPDEIVSEAEMAAEWIADPKRNKRHKQMSLGFLNTWLRKAEEPASPPAFATLQATGTDHHAGGTYTYAAGTNGRADSPRKAHQRALTQPDSKADGEYAAFVD